MREGGVHDPPDDIRAAAAAALATLLSVSQVQADQAFGRQWDAPTARRIGNRFYHYPYVYYRKLLGARLT